MAKKDRSSVSGFRVRASNEYKDELIELARWVNEPDMSAVTRRAIEELKESSGFNDRDGFTEEPPVSIGPPGFTPGTW